MRLFFVSLSAMLLIGIHSCKKIPGDEASLESLDNFEAGHNTSQNECSGQFMMGQLDPRVKEIIEKENLIRVPSQLKQNLETALSSVPTSLKNVFFSQSYSIEVANGNAERCAKITGNPEDVACFERSMKSKDGATVPEGQKAESEHITVLIEANPKSIRFGTLRAFGYLLSQRFSKLSVDAQNNPIYLEKDDQQFEEWKRDITVNMLHDIATRRGITDKTFGRHRNLLTNDPNLIGKSATLVQRMQAWSQYVTSAASNAEHFSTFTLAEAVDSYWCSNISTGIMKKDFPATYKLFSEELAQPLVGAWSSVVAGKNMDEAPEGQGFGLRWFGRSRCSSCVGGMCRCGNSCCNARYATTSTGARGAYNWGAGGFPGGLRQRVNSPFPRLATGRLFPRLWGY